jgi:hypothetical protein
MGAAAESSRTDIKREKVIKGALNDFATDDAPCGVALKSS